MIHLSLISALFIYMLDYGLGKPGDEKPLYTSLLFAWSFYLAKKALGAMYPPIYQQYKDQLTGNKLQDAQTKASFKEIVFTQGRQLFTWQKIFGMCPICTHFWFTLFLFLFCFQGSFLNFTLYFLVSHLIIRLLKKWI